MRSEAVAPQQHGPPSMATSVTRPNAITAHARRNPRSVDTSSITGTPLKKSMTVHASVGKPSNKFSHNSGDNCAKPIRNGGVAVTVASTSASANGAFDPKVFDTQCAAQATEIVATSNAR